MNLKVFWSALFLSIFFDSPLKAQWVQVADFAGAERDDLVAFTCNARAFAGTGMAVGFQVSNDFYEYKPASDQWVPIANLPGTSRQYAFCFSFETMAFVFAGINQAGNDLKDGYSFNPITDAWANVNAYPGNGSKGCAAATCRKVMQVWEEMMPDYCITIGGSLILIINPGLKNPPFRVLLATLRPALKVTEQFI